MLKIINVRSEDHIDHFAVWCVPALLRKVVEVAVVDGDWLRVALVGDKLVADAQ